MTMNVSFESLLRLAPLNTTHWGIDKNKFVRMGCAVVEGYLSLEVMRRVSSHKIALSLKDTARLKRIVKSAPPGSHAFSLKSHKYIASMNGRFYSLASDGVMCEVLCPSDIIELVYLEHAETYVDTVSGLID